jgi:5'-3' exonuclease
LLVLFDGDIGRYRWGFAAEKTRYLVELVNAGGHREFHHFDAKKEADSFGERTTKGVSGAFFRLWNRKELQPVENCLQIAKASISQTIGELEEKYSEKADLRVFLSGKTNFREGIAKSRPYKGNRDNVPRPSHYKALGDYLVEQWDASIVEGHEADDAISIAAVEAKEAGKKYVVVSNDKDLDQIPGSHYNWITKEFYYVSPKEAKVQFYTQVLTGDSTDNIPGLEGVGPATAEKALAECKTPHECFNTVKNIYYEHLGFTQPKGQITDKWARYLVEQADLVWILKKPGEKWSDTKEGAEFCHLYLSPSAVV